MKKRIIIYLAAAAALLTVCFFQLSEDSYNYTFKTPKEAVAKGREQLSNLKKKETISTSSLTKEVRKWIALRDSAYSCFMKADSADINNQTLVDFYNVSDSISIEMSRLARSKERTAKDLVYIQKNTATKRSETQDSQLFKDAVAFFNGIPQPDKTLTLEAAVTGYKRLLGQTKNLTKEQELLQFIKAEDQYFQVIMQNLTEAKTEDLEDVAQHADRFFSRLTLSLSTDLTSESNNRILMYLHMRVNRRVIINTRAVCQILDSNVKLSDTQKMLYRWMLLQPFMSLDNYSWTYMTDDQEKNLSKLAKNLHEYLLKIENPKAKNDKKEEKELQYSIGKYLIVAYLKQMM